MAAATLASRAPATLSGGLLLCLAVSMISSMSSTRAIAAALGRLGGQARARRLSSSDRKRIAALGGTARKQSLVVARRIADNFAYLTAMQELGGRRPTPARISNCKGPLPGLYPDRK